MVTKKVSTKLGALAHCKKAKWENCCDKTHVTVGSSLPEGFATVMPTSQHAACIKRHPVMIS